jgi:hypothetical protein
LGSQLHLKPYPTHGPPLLLVSLPLVLPTAHTRCRLPRPLPDRSATTAIVINPNSIRSAAGTAPPTAVGRPRHCRRMPRLRPSSSSCFSAPQQLHHPRCRIYALEENNKRFICIYH